MIDLPDREVSRFPPRLEEPARDAIAAEIERWRTRDSLQGFASGARGGDILFHEECRKRDIGTVLVLPFAPELFVQRSVTGIPGSDWVTRFWTVWHETPGERRFVLGLPDADQSFSRCNINLLERAKRAGAVHLLALWDGKKGDGEGGTADMIERAQQISDTPFIIAPHSLAERQQTH